MASSEHQQQTFPTIPPSHSAGDHETRDYYGPQELPRPTANQAPYITPYLGLRARLSQIWVNRWTILLLLVLIRTLLAVASLKGNINSARSDALRACTKVEDAGSALASMPYYASRGVNAMTAQTVTKAVNGLMSMLTLGVTAIEEIVLFIINLLTSTYVCLITLAVAGSLRIALNLINDVTGFVNKTVGAIGTDIANVAGSFTNDLNKFVGTLNSIPFVDNKVPKLDIGGGLDKLKTISIPASFTDDIKKLNNSIPDFKDVQEFTNGVIRKPFQLVKGLINDHVKTYQFNQSVLPIAKKQQLTFCKDDDGINKFFDGLISLENKAKKIFIAVLLIAAILVCGPMAWWEIKRFRRQQERSTLISSQATDPLDVVYMASRPHTSSFGLTIGNRFASLRKQTLVRWTIAYATSPPALFVLALGIAGLLGCLAQYILLQVLKSQVPDVGAQVGAFAEKVVVSLNETSAAWANDTNKVINGTNNDINTKVFGWVTSSTSAVNSTLNAFVDEMSKGLDKAFGNTPLKEPIKEVINCLIGLKIAGVQKGLTWVHDNAHVNFPLMPNDTFSLGAIAQLSDGQSDDEFVRNPAAKTKEETSGVMNKLIKMFESGIRQEAIISICIVLIWLIIFLMGAGWAIFKISGEDKTRAEAGQQYPGYDDQHQTDDFLHNSNNRNMNDGTLRPDPETGYPRPMSTAPPGYSQEPYTLSPKPFPTFGDNEKHGNVGARSNLDVVEPTHLRSSSHGALGGLSPVNEKRNPYRY